MKILNKQELQQIKINNSFKDFKDFTNNYKIYTAKPHSFLLNDTSRQSDNPLSFRSNL